MGERPVMVRSLSKRTLWRVLRKILTLDTKHLSPPAHYHFNRLIINKMTKQEALNKIEELKKFVDETDKKAEEKVIGIAIKNRFTGSIIFQSTKTTFKEAIIEKGDTDLCDADLRNADLRCADLCNANLCDADLRGADLRNADLRGADLRDADLCDADLCDADLCNANLRNADLRGADLCDTELNSAKFYGRGGTKRIMKKDLEGFLGALGFVLEE